MIKHLIFIWSFANVYLNAESQSFKDTIHIVQVEITSDPKLSNKGVNKTCMDSITLMSSITGDLSDLLTKNSSIFIKNYGQGGLATASFRGTAPSHTQVLWNGIPVNSAMYGWVDLSLLPVFFADEVSLYYGSSSLTKGTGALGGTITIENNADWYNRYKTSLVQGFGSFQNYQTFFSFGAGNNRFQSNTRIIRESGENNYCFYNPNFFKYLRQTNASFKKYGLMQELYFKPGSSNSLSIKSWRIWDDRNFPPLMSTLDDQKKYRENQKDYSINVVGEFKQTFSNGNFNLTSGYTNSKMLYYQNPDIQLANVKDSTLNTSSLFFAKTNYTNQFTGFVTLETGISFYKSFGGNNDYLADTSFKANRNDFSGYVRLGFNPNKKLAFIFLIVQNVSDNKKLPSIPSLSTEYQIIAHNKLVLKANIARNYHLPTLSDLYFIPGGNPVLKPEEGFTGDIALNHHVKLGNLIIDNHLSIFSSLINNWIIWEYSSFNYWTPKNFKKVFSRGFEYFLSAQGVLSNLKYNIRANYSYTRTTSEEDEAESGGYSSYGKQLIYIPVHLYNLLTTFEYHHWYLNHSLNYTGNRYASSGNENGSYLLPRYLLNNVSLGRKIILATIDMDLQLKINNIFSVHYEPLQERAMPLINNEIILRINFKHQK